MFNIDHAMTCFKGGFIVNGMTQFETHLEKTHESNLQRCGNQPSTSTTDRRESCPKKQKGS